MRILGLDPGTATTGYGIIDATDGRLTVVDYGVILTPPEDSPAIRLQSIYRQLTDLLERFTPATAAVEQVFFGRNITTAIAVGQARGVMLLALANSGLIVSEYSPPQVKEAVTGYGKADKAQVQMMVQNILELAEKPRPDDAADALAVAITHFNFYHFQSLVNAQ